MPIDATAEERLTAATDVNRQFYGNLTAGRDDYWRLMAAPRFRVRTILSVLADVHPRAIVDLGCGNGQLLEEIGLASPSTARAGIDVAGEQIAANLSRDPRVKWEVRDLQKPFAANDPMAGQYDVVVASELIEHLADPEMLLRNARILARDRSSRLILTTQSGPVRETERRVGHQRHFTPEDLRLVLERGGWRPIRIWNAGFPFHDLSKWAANLDPDRSMREFDQRSYGARQRLACWLLRGAFRLNSNRRGAQLFAIAEPRE